MITYDVLQHYSDEECRHKSALTKKVVLKDNSQMFSEVFSCFDTKTQG